MSPQIAKRQTFVEKNKERARTHRRKRRIIVWRRIQKEKNSDFEERHKTTTHIELGTHQTKQIQTKIFFMIYPLPAFTLRSRARLPCIFVHRVSIISYFCDCFGVVCVAVWRILWQCARLRESDRCMVFGYIWLNFCGFDSVSLTVWCSWRRWYTSLAVPVGIFMSCMLPFCFFVFFMRYWLVHLLLIYLLFDKQIPYLYAHRGRV